MDYSKFTKEELLEFYKDKSLTASTLAEKASGPRRFDESFINSLENLECRLCAGDTYAINSEGEQYVNGSRPGNSLMSSTPPCRRCNYLRHILGDLHYKVEYKADRERVNRQNAAVEIPKLTINNKKEDIITGIQKLDELVDVLSADDAGVSLDEEEWVSLKWTSCTNCGNKVGAQDSDGVKFCEVCMPAREAYVAHRDGIYASVTRHA